MVVSSCDSSGLRHCGEPRIGQRASQDAENAHRSSTGFARMMSSMPELLDGPPAVLRMEPLRMALQETVLSEDWAF